MGLWEARASARMRGFQFPASLLAARVEGLGVGLTPAKEQKHLEGNMRISGHEPDERVGSKIRI